MRMRAGAIFLALALATPAAAQRDTDHPLVTRYARADLTDKQTRDFATYALIVGVKGTEFERRPVEGRLTQIRYTNPPGRSVEEIFANYGEALRRAGATELFRCADAACGPAYAASRWNRFNGTINIGANSRYLAARVKTAAGEAHVAVAVNPQGHQVTIVEGKAMESGLVTVDPAALGRELDANGHVAIPGVHFETGKATLTPESETALKAMAEILKARPAAKVWIVGHTDWTGGFELNLKLSDERAKAVATALVERHKIARDRLSGHGVGPLSPAASNAGDQGRGANRRVELVLRP
ncbi:MAG: DUF4892 domain-containing protein [Alphaproteobacteria bacterium]